MAVDIRHTHVGEKEIQPTSKFAGDGQGVRRVACRMNSYPAARNMVSAIRSTSGWSSTIKIVAAFISLLHFYR
jgi:hypothetical protein